MCSAALATAGPRLSGAEDGRRRILLRRAVDHAGKAAEACLRDLAQHEIIRGAPGIAAGFAGGLFAGQAQRALLVAVETSQHPGDHGFAAHDLRGG